MIVTTNRLNATFLGEIGTGVKEQDTKENSNQCQSVWPRCETAAGADAWGMNSQISLHRL